MAATAAAATELAVEGPLRWYRATPAVHYGFCGECGSTLFWRSADNPETVSIAAGTLDPPTGLKTAAALFVSEASDYHRLDDSVTQYELDH